MKQRITEEQWNELSKKQQTMFCDNFEEINEHPLLVEPNIGILIEFIGKDVYTEMDNGFIGNVDDVWYVYDCSGNRIEKIELVDALWEVVKEKLCE